MDLFLRFLGSRCERRPSRDTLVDSCLHSASRRRSSFSLGLIFRMTGKSWSESDGGIITATPSLILVPNLSSCAGSK
jgi:hypothetical protein